MSGANESYWYNQCSKHSFVYAKLSHTRMEAPAAHSSAVYSATSAFVLSCNPLLIPKSHTPS